MKRATFAMLALVTVTLGCRVSDGPFAAIMPSGSTRVPPPVTGSIGTPIPQPTAGQYYPGGSAQAVPAANNIGWQAAPSTSLSINPPTSGPGAVATTPVVNSNPHVAALNPAATGVMGPAAGQNPGQVTNPAMIRNQAAPATNPWQPAGNQASSPQLFKTNAAPVANSGAVNSALGSTLGINTGEATNTQPQPPVNSATPGTWGQPNTWGQPPNGQPASNGYQIPVGNPNSPYPLQGMPVNDATSQYPAASPWSLSAWRNWWMQRQQQAQQPYPPQYQQAQAVAPVGYASAAPQPGQLPVRGMQAAAPTVNAPVAPASMQWGSVPNGEVQTPQAAPAVQQWGGLPMASIQPVSFTSPNMQNAAPDAATVRGNDEGDAPATSAAASRAQIPVDASSATGRFAYDANYQWLRGQLEYSLTERRWKLRYIPHDAPEGRIDTFGGSVVLTPTAKLSGFESGAFVMVRGRIAATEGGASDYAPIYTVESVSDQ